MPRYVTEITSPWTAPEAFAYMSDFANAQEWDPGVLRASRLETGEIDRGSSFDLTVKVGRRTKTLRYRVEEIDPGRTVVFVASTGRLLSRDTLTFAPRGPGVTMTYEADLRFTGWAALANPLLGLALRRIGDRARDSLRRVLGEPRETR